MKGKNLFNSVQVPLPKSNSFDLSHSVKMTGNFGNIMPCMVIEVGPGENHKIGNELLVRMEPMIFPVIDRMNVFVHTFFVPNRIVWSNWDEYISNTKIGGVLTPVIPKITIDGTLSAAAQKFLDYFGIPPYSKLGGTTPTPITALALAAYQKIYNDYYRDEQLVPEVSWELIDGDNSANADLTTMRRRAFEHDYFTSARIDAQYGDAVDIPLGVVELDPDWATKGSQPQHVGASTVPIGDVEQNVPPGYTVGGTNVAYDPDGSLVVGATTINALRTAERIQRLLERFNIAGNRYIEVIKANYGVEALDARLQRPEYITGSKVAMNISQVLSTSQTDDLPQGNMAGHGIAVGAGYTGSYFTREHGYIISVMTIMPRTTYAEGIPRHFSRLLWNDYPWPELAHLGEQGILNQELFAYQSNRTGTFGYTPRFAEKRYIPSRIAGNLRDTGYDAWTLARIFGASPNLNKEFIECDPEQFERIFAVPPSASDTMIIHIVNKVLARMPYPVYGTPML